MVFAFITTYNSLGKKRGLNHSLEERNMKNFNNSISNWWWCFTVQTLSKIY